MQGEEDEIYLSHRQVVATINNFILKIQYLKSNIKHVPILDDETGKFTGFFRLHYKDSEELFREEDKELFRSGDAAKSKKV
ncbi:hypothetical protein DDB_G0280653 [Dictyostelium discoideum AX4]|uniref:Uncharacterized protein n=1 Tax=Dictyostelium discoideum TaxID=44689 RepID=Q54V26_DICDI|nr:hypothetical protein DDB_G0280653 [Dictyostelium discoideum AX4]EAL67128.1 hypothetical protein DDB_G0280653 [Dictyostelium discoideum AX4]|eukprot:XP_641105.1 hypothetical protein DDB_G0280653 [Dictyostelium discoideum AX4]